MFPFKHRFKEYGIISICIGVGILLGLLLPPIGWMVGCALGMICCGIYILKSFC